LLQILGDGLDRGWVVSAWFETPIAIGRLGNSVLHFWGGFVVMGDRR